MAATKERPVKGESVDAFLMRLTHLQLQGQRLGPAFEALQRTPAVYVLYAYDNMLSSLAGIENLRKLQQLYLQNNRLTDMVGIEALPQLKKLHLGHNRLSRVEALENCRNLEELFVPHQRPPGSSGGLEFCEQSMAAIAPTLRVLDLADNRIRDASCLAPLSGLVSLDLADNELASVQELRQVLSSETLTRVTLYGNPLSAPERRHRTKVVLLAPAIEEIDGKEVLPQERDFVRRLEEQKRKLEVQRHRIVNNRTGGPSSPVVATSVGTKVGASSPGAASGDMAGSVSAPPVLSALVH